MSADIQRVALTVIQQGVEQPTANVLRDVAVEREMQIAKGWTREHDKRHAVRDLVNLAKARLIKVPKGREEGFYYRKSIIQAIAILVALVEAQDERESDW
jgi:hypothetical protein